MLDNPLQIKDKIVQWIRDYLEENGKETTLVIGISGGKDSSVTAALCVEAVGKERIIGVLMPDGHQADIDSARKLVEHLGIFSLEVNINSGVRGVYEAIYNSKGFQESQCRLEGEVLVNLPPRIRMTTLYAIAQSLPKGGRVVNTCNLSEDYVGYSTKFGDSAGDFSPLAQFLVHEVKQIGRVLNLPEDLIEKVPSDGLSGMSDEDKLGFTYEALDHYILTGECEDLVTKEKIDRLHRLNLHKLRPMPAFDFGRGLL